MTHIKHSFRYLLILSISFFIFGCNQEKSFKVGLLLDEITLQERWNKDRQYFIEKTIQIGGTVIDSIANGDDARQYNQAIALLKQDIDVLVIVPVNLETASKIVDEAHAVGVKVIAYDRLIQNCDLDYYISFDNVEVGILQAKYVLSKISKGNIALINGPTTDNNSFLLRLGHLSVLQPLIEKGDIKLVYDKFVTDWSQTEGYNNMVACLSTDSTLDAVIAGNDNLANGVIKAYYEKDSTAKAIIITGQDAELSSIKMIENGQQSMTVYKPLLKAAEIAADVAKKLALNQEIDYKDITSINNNKKMVPTILISPITVDKNNIQETVIKDGFINSEDLLK